MKVRRTYITKMPDKAGAFLKASRVISENDGNIVRVNYNKAVDAHTLFIEVNAEADSHVRISEMLSLLGYLTEERSEKKVILIVLKLEDTAGAVKLVLEVINNYDINVTYISSQENGTRFQYFKMGLMVENAFEIKRLLEDISAICEVKILDYDITEKSLDNTVFYITFANEMRDILKLSQENTNEVIINSNRIMQMLDDREQSPLKTFDYIKQFAYFVTSQKGEAFEADVDIHELPDGIKLYTIQPPCGSNTYIIHNGSELLFIDCGFACYHDEMNKIFTKLLGDMNAYHKDLIITHADIDHTGLSDMFDNIYMSGSCYENFRLESEDEPNFREQNVLHAPYCKLSKIISDYHTPMLEKCVVIGNNEDDELLSYIGARRLAGLELDFYEGSGGHVRGETVIVCEKYKLVFTGDIFVNVKGFSEKQSRFNVLAPYLMTSVNVDPKKSRELREYTVEKYGAYTLCPGHGAVVLAE